MNINRWRVLVCFPTNRHDSQSFLSSHRNQQVIEWDMISSRNLSADSKKCCFYKIGPIGGVLSAAFFRNPTDDSDAFPHPPSEPRDDSPTRECDSEITDRPILLSTKCAVI